MGTLYQFSDLPSPVALDVPPDVLDLIAGLLPGWHITRWQAGARAPVITMETRRPSGAFALAGHRVPPGLIYDDPVDAACALIAELIRAYVNERPDHLCLHAAAALYGGRLVVFPSARRAGKSTLCAAIGASGQLIVGDDIVLIDPESGDGIAGGFCPRLRLPLPGSLSARTLAFIERNCGPVGMRYAYLDLGPDALAVKGDRHPIGAFVLLDRRDEAAADLVEIETSAALQAIIEQNFARSQPAAYILDRLFALIAARPAYRLTFARADDAANLLERSFRDWPERDGPTALRPPSGEAPARMPEPAFPAPFDSFAAGGAVYRQKPDVAERQANGQSFLANNRTGRITMLNETASAIWRALAEPATLEELVELVLAAFPAAERAAVETDVRAILQTFLIEDLISAQPIGQPAGG